MTDDARWYTKVGETLPSRRDGVSEPNVYERQRTAVQLSARTVSALHDVIDFMADEFARVGYVQDDQGPAAMRALFDEWKRTRRADPLAEPTL